MSLAKKLRNLREDLEPPMTQTKVASALGMNQRKLSHLERGDSYPSPSDLKALCLYYHVSADYLLDLPKDLPYPDE
ncbi:MAG: helix-turn-helix transcriptional regulator [Clostridiales bacterium]|nr:helix-turn-helix transcriptional regulator [Clostridiales bacterium]